MKMRKYLNDESLELIAAQFRILSDSMRLKILHTLGAEEMNVSELVAATGGGQANVSKHLGILLEARIVARRKEGLNAFYRVADGKIFELCEVVCNSLDEQFAAKQKAVRNYVER